MQRFILIDTSAVVFLRPGIIIVQDKDEKKFYVEEGIVEFSNNELLILTSTIKDIKYLDKNLINNLMEQAEKKFKDENSTDKEKYILSYKIGVFDNFFSNPRVPPEIVNFY